MGKVVVRVQIVRLFEFCDSCASLLGLCVADGKRELEEYLANPSVEIYTAESDKRRIGLICVLITPDSIDLLDIAVDPQFRRTGIGKKLITFVSDNQKKPIFLEVRASNQTAMAFYESLGFERISVRKKYYSAPTEDAIIYRREL